MPPSFSSLLVMIISNFLLLVSTPLTFTSMLLPISIFLSFNPITMPLLILSSTNLSLIYQGSPIIAAIVMNTQSLLVAYTKINFNCFN